jgi:transposase-like protein
MSLASVLQLSEAAAWDMFKAMRWAETQGQPVCPRCACTVVYTFRTRQIFKCKRCEHQFSVTSGTIFASRKISIGVILSAIAIFLGGAKGYPALQLSRALDVQYKTAFVLSHKIREALGATLGRDQLNGVVEVDGAYFGGYVKPANRRKERIDRRLAMHRTGRRQVVVVIRERGGRTFPFVAASEAAGVPVIARNLKPGSVIHADEAPAYDVLEAGFAMHRINHGVEYSNPSACTNMAESFFSRLRRAETGVHHHIAGLYLSAYALEQAWREDNRRLSTGEQLRSASRAALGHPVSRRWKGYWQRRRPTVGNPQDPSSGAAASDFTIKVA